MLQCLALATGIVGLAVSNLFAQSIYITDDRPDFSVRVNGVDLNVTRDATGLSCPPACIQPLVSVPGVVTVGELEVLSFIEMQVAKGHGLIIDVRSPDAFQRQTLPGAVNVPQATLSVNNPYREDLLSALAVTDGSDFSAAFDLLVFSDGPDSPDAVQAVRDLVGAGYPPSKLRYYRGGLMVWRVLGLSTAHGG